MVRSLLVLFVLGACFVVGLSAASCEPSCVDTGFFGTRKCFDPTTKVEDPMNCTQYYFCLDNCEPTQVPLPCDPGNIFDPTSRECVGGTECDPSCKPGTCHLTCNGTGDMISDVTDCHNYFICYPHGPEGPFTCGSDAPFFNGETCVTDDTDCCSDMCTPYCDAVGVQIPDPHDCTKYYICTDAGEVPGENLHFTCKPGENFNVAEGRCVKGAPCEIVCQETTGAGAVTTKGPASTAAATTGGASTPAVTPTSECANSITCTSVGNVPKCVTCQPEYFYCPSVGAAGEPRKCSGDLVFNPNPGFPYCVQPSNCPYTP